MDEIELLNAVKNGDKYALDQLVSLYYRQIFAYFFRNTCDYHISNDLTQEVFVKMLSAIGRYRNEGHFKAWLMTIAANHLRNYWTYCKVHKRETLLDGKDEKADLSRVNTVESVEVQDMVKKALMELPLEQREVVILKYYHDMKFEEIARVTNSKLSTAKSRLRYAIRRLRRIIYGGETCE